MTEHAVVTRDEWLAARKELLDEEQQHAQRSEELTKRRQELPWVRVEKDYTFDTDEGKKSLAELFDGRSQLLAVPYYSLLLDQTPNGRQDEFRAFRKDEYPDS